MWIILTCITLPDFILFSLARTPEWNFWVDLFKDSWLAFSCFFPKEFSNLNNTVNVWENLISVFIFQVKLKVIHLNSCCYKWDSDCNIPPSQLGILYVCPFTKIFSIFISFYIFSDILLFSSRTCVKLYVSYCYWEYTCIRIIIGYIINDNYVIWLYHIINIFHISLIFIPILCAFASPLL